MLSSRRIWALVALFVLAAWQAPPESFAVSIFSEGQDLTTAPGWTLRELVPGVDANLDGFIDADADTTLSGNNGPVKTSDDRNAWQLNDQNTSTARDLPQFQYIFPPDQAREMALFGFTLTVEFENVGTGGGFWFGFDDLSPFGSADSRVAFISSSSFSLDGMTHTARLTWDPSSQTLSRSFDAEAPVTLTFGANSSNNYTGPDDGSASFLVDSGSGAGTTAKLNFVSADLLIEPDPGSLELSVNRSTGEIRFDNASGASIDNIIGYTILSPSGALSQANWDKQSVGSQLANDDDQWTVLTGAGVTTDLAEAILATTGAGDGGDLTSFGGDWSFGNVWQKGRFEDIAIELLVDDGSEEGLVLLSGEDFFIEYSGDELDPADLDANGVVDAADWVVFKSLYGTDVADMTDFDAYYNGGDINLDGVSNMADFVAYRGLYAAATAPGTGLPGSSVPEPATCLLALMGAALVGARRAWFGRQCTLILAFAVGMAMHGTAQALTYVLYDADPDNNAATAAPDPTTMGWQINNLDGSVTNAGFSTTGTTSGGAHAWVLNDAGPTGVAPNQSNALVYPLDPFTIDQMDSGGFTLSIEFEQFATGSFVGIGYNYDGVDSDFGLSADSRYGQSPTVGTQTYTYSWDGTALTLNPGAGGPAGFLDFWGGATPGGGQLFFGDNTRNSSAFNLAITKVTLDGPDLNPVEVGVNVNLTTGNVTLFGDDVTNIEVVGYSLTSELGQLLPGALNSLQNQHVGDPAMDPNNGVGFEVLGTPSVNEIAEGDLTGSTLITNSTNYSLGNIFNTATAPADRDLVFTLTTSFGAYVGDVNYVTGVAVDGDYNGNGVVDAADYTVWRDSLNQSGPGLAADGDGNDVVNELDYTYWKARFGNTAIGGGTALTASSVPEPSSIFLLSLAGCIGLCVARRNRSSVCSGRIGVAAAVLGALLASSSVYATQVDREYRLGDDGDGVGASAGLTLSGVTYDNAGTVGLGDLQDLAVVGAPVYRNVSDRPGAGVNGLGVEFNGSTDALTTTISMNAPAQMYNNATFFPTGMIFPHNYAGIFSHGIQLWAKPDQAALGAATQTLVRDTVMHGIGITDGGNWSLLYDNLRIDTNVPVATTLDENGWAHVMELSGFSSRFAGSSAAGGALLVNGIAVAATGATYDPSATPLVVGAEASGEAFQNYYDGVLDDVDVFFWGDNSAQLGQDGVAGGSNTNTAGNNGLNADGQDWGRLNLAVDNDWIAQRLASLNVTDLGDVNLSGGAADASDIAMFVSNWRFRQLVGGVQIGDWNSRQLGDLNYDGIVNLHDAYILNNSLAAAGLGGLDFALLEGGAGVPEPSTWVLAVLGLASLLGVRRHAA